ncbi:MAG: cupin domain-containing protein [Bosea sp. (in: a-proteobacteria)]
MNLAPHPGFGLFGKAHREFFDALADDGWTPVAGYHGVEEKILSGALNVPAKQGCVTRLARWAPGALVAYPVSHLWCEEVFILSGSLFIGLPDEADAKLLPTGTFACRPAHVVHGPFFSREGCVLLEFMYFPPTNL